MRNSCWLLTTALALAFSQAACQMNQDAHMQSGR